MKRMSRNALMFILAMSLNGSAYCVPKPKIKQSGHNEESAVGAREKKSGKKSDSKFPFYVYEDQTSRNNHFIPSGWMGDWGDMKIDTGYKDNPKSGKTCVRITYNAKRSQEAGWAGIYWQHPANNWGGKKGGFDITGAKKLSFWARGENGGEKIAEFKVGGITSEIEDGDSDSVSIGPIELNTEWQKYVIDLEGLDLSHIIGGFCWAASGDENPEGFTLYLDEIKYEN